MRWAPPRPEVYRFNSGGLQTTGIIFPHRKGAMPYGIAPPVDQSALESLSSRRSVLLPPPLTEPYVRFSRIRLFSRSLVVSRCLRRYAGKELMTNIYPFLVGKAAIYHERMTDFPETDEPENHALGVHCGYAGFAPRPFCGEKWKIVPKVLEIVNEKAVMVNCELPAGDMVLAKINPSFDRITVIPGKLEKYLQFPGTDARNASLLHYHDGEKVMEELPSHHQMIIIGRHKANIIQIARVFGWKCEVI